MATRKLGPSSETKKRKRGVHENAILGLLALIYIFVRYTKSRTIAGLQLRIWQETAIFVSIPVVIVCAVWLRKR